MQAAGKSLAAITLMGGFASAVVAQVPFNKPELAIKYRQSAMFIQAQHFNHIGAVVKGERPYEKDELIRHAMLIEEMAKTYRDGFSPATERASNTKAKEEIWKEPEKFRAAGQSRTTKSSSSSARSETATSGPLSSSSAPWVSRARAVTTTSNATRAVVSGMRETPGTLATCFLDCRERHSRISNGPA
jgi:cytochrome c556